MITSWGIAEFECYVHQNGHNNVIKSIKWNYLGLQGDYFSEINGVTALELPHCDFIEFEELTKEMVIDILESKLDMVAMNTKLQADIDNQINDRLTIIKPNW